jgi:hypothetical protein
VRGEHRVRTVISRTHCAVDGHCDALSERHGVGRETWQRGVLRRAGKPAF